MSETEGYYPHEVTPPPFTVLEQRGDGLNMVTRVILDGEYAEFSVPVTVFRAGRALRDLRREAE